MIPEDSGNPDQVLVGEALFFTEILEGGKEFLDAINSRLNEIIGRPRGRYVISYVSEVPGSRRPPRVN